MAQAGDWDVPLGFHGPTYEPAQPTCLPPTHIRNLPKKARGEPASGDYAGELGASPK